MATTRDVGETLLLVAIVGPTASGKTAAAIEIALRCDGEIICADSRTIYKGMDIGTAKPTEDEQAVVPHWGLDLVSPGERFTVADFKRYADAKIREIRARGHTPILVGGTGLYVDAVVFGYRFGSESNDEQRRELEAMDITELQEYCVKNNITLPENKQNKRHLIRTIERNGEQNRDDELQDGTTIIVGIATSISTLRTRIAKRAEHILNNGVVEEAMKLGEMYGWDNEAMTGNVYPIIRSYLDGTYTHDETVVSFATKDRQLAKRQMTWFRRRPEILWVEQPRVVEYVVHSLKQKRRGTIEHENYTGDTQ